ncbi:MAG: transposase, partial [Boseongicola sp. SB0667_bin_21]|nr:transposase [Boseongicola sp. SB0667_bin_21]
MYPNIGILGRSVTVSESSSQGDRGMSGDRHDMSDAEWEILRSVIPQKHQGPRPVRDRRVMDGIFFVLRTGTAASSSAPTASETSARRHGKRRRQRCTEHG